MKWDVIGSSVGRLQDAHEVADIFAGSLSFLRVRSRISTVVQVSFGLSCLLASAAAQVPVLAGTVSSLYS